MKYPLWLARGSPHPIPRERWRCTGPPHYKKNDPSLNWQLHTNFRNQGSKMTIEMIEAEEFNQGTQIKVIGVGGGGKRRRAHDCPQRAGR